MSSINEAFPASARSRAKALQLRIVAISETAKRPTVQARFFSLMMLGGVVTVFSGVTHAGYRAVKDSFVSPTILSPDSDVVVSTKLKLSELQVERDRTSAELESIEADLVASKNALQRLDELKESSAQAVLWTSRANARKETVVRGDLERLGKQRQVIEAMVGRQRQLTAKARIDLVSGVISRTEAAKEIQALNQLELALIENDRAHLLSRSRGDTSNDRVKAAATQPDEMVWREQVIRLELDTVRMESEQRGKEAQRRALIERVATIDRLIADLSARPIFRAIEHSLDLAFVPYTQLSGVVPGASVYTCLWGMIYCDKVGSVSEVVPGEVSLSDPWGNPARGQYAVLKLTDPLAARAKVLRVRPEATAKVEPLQLTKAELSDDAD